MTEKLLTVKEASEILGVKTARLYQLSREGKLPFLVRIGERQYKYDPHGLANWIRFGGNHFNPKVEAQTDGTE